MGSIPVMRRLVAPALLALVLLEGVAAAQSTGGSMGGGSFGGGSSSSSSSGGGSWGSSSSSWSSSGGGGSYAGGCDGGTGAAVVLLLVLFLVITIALDTRRIAAKAAGSMDVSVLRLGLDWKARKFVQKEMERIARTCNTSTTDGLLAMLREVALTLRRSRDSWVYAGVVNCQPAPPPQAERRFQEEAQRARAGFQHELVRAASGTVTTGEAPAELRARPEEGPGLVVITIVVAARTALIDFQDPSDAEQVRRWLEAISGLHTGSLVAVEVIWTPAADEDRMSSVELENFYPEMKRIRGNTVVGKMDCTYCGGSFPAELLSCPHCGGKVKDAA